MAEQNFFGLPVALLETAAPHSGQNRSATFGRNSAIAQSKSVLSGACCFSALPIFLHLFHSTTEYRRFSPKTAKKRKKERAVMGLLQPFSFRAAPQRLLPVFLSGQAKTHEKVRCSGAFSCALVYPGRVLENSAVPFSHVLWFYTDSLRPPAYQFCGFLRLRGPRSSVDFTVVK